MPNGMKPNRQRKGADQEDKARQESSPGVRQRRHRNDVLPYADSRTAVACPGQGAESRRIIQALYGLPSWGRRTREYEEPLSTICAGSGV